MRTFVQRSARIFLTYDLDVDKISHSLHFQILYIERDSI